MAPHLRSGRKAQRPLCSSNHRRRGPGGPLPGPVRGMVRRAQVAPHVPRDGADGEAAILLAPEKGTGRGEVSAPKTSRELGKTSGGSLGPGDCKRNRWSCIRYGWNPCFGETHWHPTGHGCGSAQSNSFRTPVGALTRAFEARATWLGIPIVQANEDFSSALCHLCNSEGRRPYQGLFFCPGRGWSGNADYDAAMNLAKWSWEHALRDGVLGFAPTGWPFDDRPGLGCSARQNPKPVAGFHGSAERHFTIVRTERTNIRGYASPGKLRSSQMASAPL